MSEMNYHLIMRKGPQPGQIYPLVNDKIIVGRDPTSDIVLQDPEVSRYHAELTRTEEGYQIRDMGSTNGTHINEQRLESDPVLLQPGQSVVFGSGITMAYEMTGGDEVDIDPPVVAAEPDSPAAADAYMPPPVRGDAPLVPALDEEERQQQRRRKMIMTTALVVFFFLCCCLALIAFMWFYGGDWLLEQMETAWRAWLLPIM